MVVEDGGNRPPDAVHEGVFRERRFRGKRMSGFAVYAVFNRGVELPSGRVKLLYACDFVGVTNARTFFFVGACERL